MSDTTPLGKIATELREGMSLSKCVQCGCMKDSLDNLRAVLPSIEDANAGTLLAQVETWQQQMKAQKYACLGCAHCFPAAALNVLSQEFPQAAGQSLACGFEIKEQAWPSVPGEYTAFCEGEACPVAVSTLASAELATQLANNRPPELCIVGKTETENIGIDKVIKNTIGNPTIHYLILAGRDPEGHQPGRTLLALAENGVDDRMRVINAPGKRPILRNVSRDEVDAFRRQVQMIDLIGCEDLETIIGRMHHLAQQPMPSASGSSCSCGTCSGESAAPQLEATPVVTAPEPSRIEMDKAGYFVILPQPDKKVIIVEHYAYDNHLLRVIEGQDARSIYWTIIENGWVSLLSHAAYLGKELARAEWSLQGGPRFIQDGA